MPSSWRYLSSTSSRISNLKGYISGQQSNQSWTSRPSGEEKQSWRAWAGQKIRVRKRGMNGSGFENTETVNVFPGWAARKYRPDTNANQAPQPFELEVFVSGYAISYRPPENASRSQRAFIRLAKGFAALPKLVDSAADIAQNSSSLAHLTPSTEALLAQVKLPPRPEDITDDYDVDELDRQLRHAKFDDTASISSSGSSNLDIPASNAVTHFVTSESIIPGADVIRRLHHNLEQRLQPFWSSVLPNRTIRLHVFATPHEHPLTPRNDDVDAAPKEGPLLSQDVITRSDGSFQVKLNINWEDLCHHPRALHIAFGESVVEHELLIVAQLLPQDGMYIPTTSTTPDLRGDASSTPLTSLTRIPITHSPIRVISDIDDTIKFSGILSGARAVFHNVFVKDLRDNIIPGMGEWYADMWNRGVRFHYVSNGPFELLPVLNEFFQISQLPQGSIKLRSYAGRSLFNGLLSAPAARKRAGVVDVLESFPDSRFMLIGDTGEQDLELYADLAREFPDRILAIFIRDADAHTLNGPDPLDDPTGWKVMGAAGTRPSAKPLIPRSETDSSSHSSTSYLGFNFGSRTPRSSRTDSGSNSPGLNLKQNLDVEPIKQRYQQQDMTHTPRPDNNIYLDTGVLSSEPDSFASTSTGVDKPDIGGEAITTPTSHSSSRMGSGPSITLNGASLPRPQPTGPYVTEPPKPIHPPVVAGLGLRKGSGQRQYTPSFKSQQTTSSTSSSSSKKSYVTDAEKKRQELQVRVWRARTQMPSGIPLRVFREPGECVEAREILDREGN